MCGPNDCGATGVSYTAVATNSDVTLLHKSFVTESFPVAELGTKVVMQFTPELAAGVPIGTDVTTDVIVTLSGPSGTSGSVRFSLLLKQTACLTSASALAQDNVCKSCGALYDYNSATPDGIYFTTGTGTAVEVYCDMTDGGSVKLSCVIVLFYTTSILVAKTVSHLVQCTPDGIRWTYNTDGSRFNFEYTGAEQTLTTISHTTEYHFDLYGAAGGWGVNLPSNSLTGSCGGAQNWPTSRGGRGGRGGHVGGKRSFPGAHSAGQRVYFDTFRQVLNVERVFVVPKRKHIFRLLSDGWPAPPRRGRLLPPESKSPQSRRLRRRREHGIITYRDFRRWPRKHW